MRQLPDLVATMKKLPIGISTFEKIRSPQDVCLYIDKTHHISNLVNEGTGYYFLSRPRRFGKSLFLDTIKQAFLGKKSLFKGLYLESHWDWSKTSPVIHLSFGIGSSYNSQENLIASINHQIQKTAVSYQICLKSKEPAFIFEELISKIYEKTQQPVVILIDEYDKPILDYIDNLDDAKINREILKSLYSVIKEKDEALRFVLLTGVSKFSKVSLFSGLNNLDDIRAC